MKEKKNIGFIINFSHEGWLGGSNYFENLLTAIKTQTKHNIKIFTGIKKSLLNPEFRNYDIIYLDILNPKKKKNILINYLRIILLIIFQRDFFLEKELNRYKIDILSHSIPVGKKSKIKSIYWIPDLQEIFLKKNFTFKTRFKRWLFNYLSAENATAVLFSSNVMREIFIKQHPKLRDKYFVLRFLNFLPPKKPIGKIYKKFKNYFLICNQFWLHKNYDLIIQTLIKLKKEKKFPIIVSTGAKKDWRSNSYFNNLLQKIKKNKLSNFKILGKISRVEQLNLIYEANYLINPSKFEGWNSAIEEAKSLGTSVIASNLKVHKEQLGKKANYFNPDDANSLKKIIKNKMNKKIFSSKKNYENLVKKNRNNFKVFSKSYEKILYHVLLK